MIQKPNPVRISKVTFKRTGLSVIIPNFSRDLPTAVRLSNDFHERAETILDSWHGCITGFYIVVWDEDGQATTAARFSAEQIPPQLLPAFIEEIVRTRTLTQHTEHLSEYIG